MDVTRQVLPRFGVGGEESRERVGFASPAWQLGRFWKSIPPLSWLRRASNPWGALREPRSTQRPVRDLDEESPGAHRNVVSPRTFFSSEPTTVLTMGPGRGGGDRPHSSGLRGAYR